MPHEDVNPGDRDQMALIRSGRALAAWLTDAKRVAVLGAGHMLMTERPHEVRRALAEHLSVDRGRGA